MGRQSGWAGAASPHGPSPSEGRSGKTKRGQQFAALPWRRSPSGIEILLISSRDSGRWIVPKGWPMEGRSGAETAATEAFEEAGIAGTIDSEPIGSFDYLKTARKGEGRWCSVTVYPMLVEKQLADWPEREQRRLLWLPAEEAAAMADDAGLAELIRVLTKRLQEAGISSGD